MNREIKFRAFIKDRNHPSQVFDENGEPTIGFMCYDLAFEQYEPINDLLAKVEHLMQYTGLKDVNGKEVYEGDIVSCSTTNYGGEKLVGEVWFNQDQISAYLEWGLIIKGVFHRTDFLGMVTVIGNVFENPELRNNDSKQTR